MTDNLPAWPPHLEGVCYDREHGWYRPVRQPDGRIHREPIPAEEVRDAGLPQHPELGIGTTTLILQSAPLRNLLPRSQAAPEWVSVD